MKGDVLLYRFPNEEKKQVFGEFQKVKNISLNSGFIIADFNLDEKYIFLQKNREASYTFFNCEVKCSSKEEYFTIAAQFLADLKKDNLSKAIFSRVKKVEKPISPQFLFDALCEVYPDAFVYLASSTKFGTWIGASPETLLSAVDGRAKTVALAGTLSVYSSENWSSKEKEEQQIVADFIEKKLKNLNIQHLTIAQREELVAGPVKHLATNFSFDLTYDELLLAVNALHPTPAVSGLPREASLELIQKYEEHSRKFYAGVVGFLSQQNTQLFVNLRCAEIQENYMYLYLGGGFTKDSSVEKEWVETERKAETLLNVMQKK